MALEGWEQPLEPKVLMMEDRSKAAEWTPPSLLFESRIQSIFTSASSAAATTARVKF